MNHSETLPTGHYQGATLNLDQNGIYRSGHNANIDYPEAGNAACFQVEANSFWFQHRNQVILTLLKRFMHIGNFADLGGGNGYQAFCIQRSFPNQQCYLIEPGYQGCLNAKAYGVEHIYNCTSEDFDFETNHVRGVGLFDVLEHIEDDADFLRSLRRQLLPGTHVYITVPAYQALWTQVDAYAGHHRRYTQKTLDEVFARADFCKVYCSYFFAYTPLPLLLLRKLPEYFRDRPSNDKDLLRSESKNLTRLKSQSAIIHLLHKIELGLLSKTKICFGGSLAGVYKIGP